MKDPKGPVKSYKSPEELSKKHKVSLEDIMKQVKIGTKVEGEHTTDTQAARITALQHIDEFPDYYTRLKKVEKKKSMKESMEVKYCVICRKNETREECSWGPEIWDRYSIAKIHPANEEVKHGLYYNVNQRRKKGLPPKKPGQKGYPTEKSWRESEKTAKENFQFHEDHKEISSGKKKDEEGYMARLEFDQMERAIAILRKHITKGDQQIPAWVQSKITRAADFIDTAAEYMASDETVSEGLKQARKNVGASKCWKGKKVGSPPTKMKGGREVPNCVPAEDTCMQFSDFMQIAEVAAWQRKEGKNQSGGLNEKGRKSYERENPGSDLKAPSKKVGNPRRASFCARMSGMKKKLTSAKTANDPNSRINKSLRAWNC